MELGNYLNLANQMSIELRELLGRYPEFLVNSATNNLDGVSLYEFRVDMEFRDVAGAAFSDIPIPGNLDRIILVEDGIKNGLVR
jgi:hypothetical protein